MKVRFSSVLAMLALCASIVPVPARADDGMAQMLHDIIAQSVPVGTPHKPLETPGLPTGWNYTLDFSSAVSTGNVHPYSQLGGGFDAVVGFGFNKHFRVQAGYYEIQTYPTGFNTGTVPLLLQGFGPIGTTTLQSASPPNNVNTLDKLTVISASYLYDIAGKIPIVISPTYLVRTGTVGGAGNGDSQTVELNGFPQMVHLRSAEDYVLPVTLPLLSTPRMFASYTAGPQWLVNTNGANTANHAQLFELGYIEYRASRRDTFFWQPGRLISYLPDDPYPQTIFTSITGYSHRFNRNLFVQVTAQTGAPTNISQLGVTAITCNGVNPAGNGCNSIVPTVRGLHASQIQIQFGLGQPSVVPL
jgi:hypothetical protein